MVCSRWGGWWPDRGGAAAGKQGESIGFVVSKEYPL